MSRTLTTITCLVVLLLASVIAAQSKTGRIVRLGDAPVGELRAGFSFAAADSCIVRHDAGIYWRIDGWVIGNELYKGYLDPAASCPQPYPFTITEINMPMVFDATTPLTVSVDVEAADLTNPNCPVPGALLAISSQYDFVVPAAGIYDIWIPLDSPITVTEPFFAGFFIGNSFDSVVNPAVITDSVPMTCASYNIWDTAIGYVDLGNNTIYNFPGRLVLYASGIPGGGGGTQPPPALALLSPADGDTLLGFSSIWAWENSGSQIIEYVVFEAAETGGSYIEIGRDINGNKALRDGVNSTPLVDGFSQFWDFSTELQGDHTLRATAFDTLGRSFSDSITVYLEPTPPVPNIVSPNNGENFCPEVDLLMGIFDEDLSNVDAYVKAADTFFTLSLLQLNQSDFGDVNGNPLDGNSVANGEFAENYSGPIAATQALRVWYDRGYKQFMRYGLSDIPIKDFVELMATRFDTRQNKGTYDESFFVGLKAHLDIFGLVEYDFYRNPDYFTLRTWVEEEERSVMLGLGGAPGKWVTVDGFSGWKQIDGSYVVRVANSESGLIEDAPMRDNAGINEIKIGTVWHSVDIMISLTVPRWTITRQLIGSDNDGTNGWSVNWAPSGLNDEFPYFFRAVGHDSTNLSGNAAILLKYSCANFFTPGDYNNDGITNLVDMMYLTDFIINSGPPPAGGTGRADANCDNNVNITDVVYYMNYMFGSANPPCY